MPIIWVANNRSDSLFENKTKVDSHAGVRNHCQADHFPNFRNLIAPQNDPKSTHQTQV